jgi:D-alanine-D-alanine ligase
MKVAVVYNRDSQAVINLFGQPNLEKIGLKVIRTIVEALRAGGHQATSFEGDKDLIQRLEDFMPRVVKGERPGMVFNVSYGIQGQARYTHVPSILEMVGVPYVASGPLAHSIALDKVVTKMVLAQNGLPTPAFAVLQDKDFPDPELPYPLIVKPKNEAVSFGIRVVEDLDQLREAASVIFDRFDQPVLAEQFVEGREVNVGVLGNAPSEALPPVELDFKGGDTVYSYEDKTGSSGREIGLICPAPLGAELTAQAQDLASRTFAAVGCADCARVDMRLDANGKLWILEINSLPAMGPRGSYVRAAKEAGLEFADLVNRLVEVASARYFGMPSPPQLAGTVDDASDQVFAFVTQRRDRLERRVREWVQRRSRTADPVGLETATRQLQRIVKDVGLRPVDDLCDERSVLTWETPAGLTDGTLLVAHMDVPLDLTLPTVPFRREGEWLYGEGVALSRAPLVTAEYALRALKHLRLLRKKRIGLLVYMDEGVDARYSAATIKAATERAARTLVLRPGGPGGHVYRQRRGQRRYRLVVESPPQRLGGTGKRPGAMVWTAQKIGEVAALSSRSERVAVSVTDLRTEGFPLLLPHRIVATLLLTYVDPVVADRVEAEVRQILGRKGPRWELELQADRPPLRDRRATRRLSEPMAALAECWDIPFKLDTSTWPTVAGLASPTATTLCGLGPEGRALYTPEESIQRISLIQRTLLLAELLRTVDDAEG